jgi:prolyl 4-hydroxylase
MALLLPAITDDLRQWVRAQIAAGCRTEDVIAAMRRSGWADDVARVAFETCARESPAEPATSAGLHLPPGVPVPEPLPDGAVSWLSPAGRPVQVLMSMRSPRIVGFGGLLSADECASLIALAQPRLARSETVDHASGGNEVNRARTSQGMFFERAETPFIAQLEERFAALLHWPATHGEGLQVLCYRPGAEYRPHHDYFDPAHPGTPAILARGGQRVATLLIYLNAPESGGATIFPDVALDINPVAGNGVFFSYDRPHAVTRTLHGGAPVLAGEKWVATLWMRERLFT